VRPELLAVSLPDVSSAAEPVQERIRERDASLQSVVARADASPGDLAAAFGELGKLLTAAEYYDTAETCFVNARALVPDDMRWPYYLGHVFRFRNEASRAAAAFEAARALSPDHVPTLVWLAEMYLAQNRPDQAEALLTRARSLGPDNGAVQFGLGRVALAKRDYTRAVEHLEGALAAAPRSTRIHYPLALAYRGLGNPRKAEEHLQLRGELQRLLRRAALAVDRHARARLGQLRRQHRHAADAARLLAGLQHAAHDHVVDQRGVGAAAFEQCVQDLCGQVDRVPAGQFAATLSACGSCGGDDISFGHDVAPW
jgi:tetratricopeptide (TPR) repeat protein